MTRHTNVQHGQKRPHTSRIDWAVCGLLLAIALAGLALMLAPMIGGTR